jgi:hypothetical protein
MVGRLKNWVAVRFVAFRPMKEPTHLVLHPFGQIRLMRKAVSPCSKHGRVLPRSVLAACGSGDVCQPGFDTDHARRHVDKPRFDLAAGPLLRRTAAPRRSSPTTWNEFLPISISIVARGQPASLAGEAGARPGHSVTGPRGSLRLNARRLDDRPPFFRIGLLQSGERLRRLLLARKDLIRNIAKSGLHHWVG